VCGRARNGKRRLPVEAVTHASKFDANFVLHVPCPDIGKSFPRALTIHGWDAPCAGFGLAGPLDDDVDDNSMP